MCLGGDGAGSKTLDSLVGAVVASTVESHHRLLYVIVECGRQVCAAVRVWLRVPGGEERRHQRLRTRAASDRRREQRAPRVPRVPHVVPVLCGARLPKAAFHTSGRSQLCAVRAKADSRSTAPTDGSGPPGCTATAPTSGSGTRPTRYAHSRRALRRPSNSRCTAWRRAHRRRGLHGRDMPYCCEAHRDGPRRRSAFLFPSSNSTVQFAPLHHLQPRVRSSSSGDLADAASTPKRRRSSVDATSPSDRESPEPP